MWRWPDGVEHEVAQMTVARWRSRLASGASKRKGLKGTSEINTAIQVRIKPDRSPLVWVSEKSKDDGKLWQRCQMKLAKFA